MFNVVKFNHVGNYGGPVEPVETLFSCLMTVSSVLALQQALFNTISWVLLATKLIFCKQKNNGKFWYDVELINLIINRKYNKIKITYALQIVVFKYSYNNLILTGKI